MVFPSLITDTLVLFTILSLSIISLAFISPYIEIMVFITITIANKPLR